MLTGIDIAELDLARACNVVYATWVADFGAFSDPVKVRDAIDDLLARVDSETRSQWNPDAWGTDDRAQAGQSAFMELAKKR